MQECCIFLNAFGPFSTLTPSGPKFLYNHTVGADARHRPVLAPEGSIGEKQKSVKNRAALLHGLAFLLLDLLFGVLRGEQPLSRAPRLGTSGTFLVLFWSQKSTHSGEKPFKTSAPPQGGGKRKPRDNKIQKNLRTSLHFRLKLCMIYYDTYSRGVCPNGIIARRN